jgi:predicted O-methyltransferase YrrM
MHGKRDMMLRGGTMNLEVVNPEIEEYLETLLPEREPWFLEMEKIAAEEDFPAVGPQVGLLLEILARSIHAVRVMDLGAGFGYSGLWLARALPADGYLLLSDFDEKKLKLAGKYFKQAGLHKIAEFRAGDALTLLEQEHQPYDLIFNDVDKEFYPQIIEPAYRLLRPGGLFVTDNTLWHGRVARKSQQPDDTATPFVREFNNRLKMHKGFLTVQVPLRDGISISIKNGPG